MDISKAKELAVKVHANFTDDIQQILNDDVDIIYVGVSPRYHKEITIQALHGIQHLHVLFVLHRCMVQVQLVKSSSAYLPHAEHFLAILILAVQHSAKYVATMET